MDFETAVQHESNNKPVIYKDHKYYVIGHNDLLKTVTIRESSNTPQFTVPVDAKPEELK